MCRGAVDKDRAIGSRAAAYLLGLDKDQRPVKGVHVDDPKAVFLLRWYQPTDAKGTVLPDDDAYKHPKGCKYYLPLDNGGYAFDWMSNYQVICGVNLKPTDKNRLFSLPAGDKKTVVGAAKDM